MSYAGTAMEQAEKIRHLEAQLADCVGLAAAERACNQVLVEAIKRMDLLAEGGICQFTNGGKHAFLKDIRKEAAKVGIQGGLVPLNSHVVSWS